MTDHVCTIYVARDAHNYGDPTTHDIGNTGQFCQAAVRTRLGTQRQLVIREEVSSPFRADVIALGVAD